MFVLVDRVYTYHNYLRCSKCLQDRVYNLFQYLDYNIVLYIYRNEGLHLLHYSKSPVYTLPHCNYIFPNKYLVHQFLYNNPLRNIHTYNTIYKYQGHCIHLHCSHYFLPPLRYYFHKYTVVI